MFFDGQSNLEMRDSNVMDNHMGSLIYFGITSNYQSSLTLIANHFTTNQGSYLLNLEGVIAWLAYNQFENNQCNGLNIINSDLMIYYSTFINFTQTPLLITAINNGVSHSSLFLLILYSRGIAHISLSFCTSFSNLAVEILWKYE